MVVAEGVALAQGCGCCQKRTRLCRIGWQRVGIHGKISGVRVGGGSGTWGNGTHFKCGPVAGAVAQNYRFLSGTLLLKRTVGRQLRSLGVICRWPDQSLGRCQKAYAQLHFKAVRCLGSNESVHALQIRGFPELVVWKSHGLKKIKGYGPELLKNLGHCLRRPLEPYLFDTKSPLRMSSSPFPTHFSASHILDFFVS